MGAQRRQILVGDGVAIGVLAEGLVEGRRRHEHQLLVDEAGGARQLAARVEDQADAVGDDGQRQRDLEGQQAEADLVAEHGTDEGTEMHGEPQAFRWLAGARRQIRHAG